MNLTAEEQSEQIASILNDYPDLTSKMTEFLKRVEKIPGIRTRKGGLGMYIPGWVIHCKIIEGEA